MSRRLLLAIALLCACTSDPPTADDADDVRARCIDARDRAIDAELVRANETGAGLSPAIAEQHRAALRVVLGDDYVAACVRNGGEP
jgi:hypothetical protein